MTARKPPATGRDEIVAVLRCLAKRLGRTPRSTEVRGDAPEMYRAICRHFGSFAAAVEAAGLAAVGVPRKWSRQLVAAELRRLHRAGEGVSQRKLIEAGRYDLVNAMVSYCGGMTAARLPPASSGPRGKSKWSEDEVVAQIRERHRRGLSLASSKVPRSCTTRPGTTSAAPARTPRPCRRPPAPVRGLSRAVLGGTPTTGAELSHCDRGRPTRA